MDSEQLTILHDHYKETCALTSDAIRRRDRLMIFVIGTLGLFAFETIFPTSTGRLVGDYLSFKFGVSIELNLSIVGNVIWFLLLVFTVRYFQVGVYVERQHEYTHRLEDELNKQLGGDMITREGKAYLARYPYFSTWTWFLYTILFPALLCLTTLLKIGNEIRVAGRSITGNTLFDATVFALLTISIVLYMLMIHSKRKDPASAN